MQVKPVHKYNPPAYPTRERANQHPELIAACIPTGWRKGKLAAATIVALALSANTHAKCADNQSENSSILSHTGIDKTDKSATKQSLIAPLFDHGDGAGTYGGMGPYGPFLSESFAIQVIVDELNKEGITIDTINYRIPDLFFGQLKLTVDEVYDDPLMRMLLLNKLKQEATTELDFSKMVDDYGLNDLTWPNVIKENFVIDGYSSALIFGFEFVSIDDRHDLFPSVLEYSTVQHYDLKKIAEALRQKFFDYGKMNAVVFYDPLSSYGNDTLLRAQVRDFIAWAKEQKILIWAEEPAKEEP